MDIHIVTFDPQTASREEWRRFHVYRRASHMETDPEDPILEDETVERADRHPHPHWDWRRLAVLDANRPNVQIGEIYFEFSRPGTPTHETNAHLGFSWLRIPKAYRRQGLGSRLLPKVVELAREHGRTIVHSWCEEVDGKAFAAAIGAKVVQQRRENRLNLEKVDWAMVEQWAKEGPARAPGTKIRWFENRIDDDVIEPYSKVYTSVMNQQPFDEASHGDFIVTPEVLLDREARNAELGGRWITVVSAEPNGDLSGLTEMTKLPDSKWMIWQGLTGVRDVYRGRGLGKWLKAEMVLRIRKEFPEVRVVATGNASSNQAMLSINERLGFRTHKEPVIVEMTREALGGYLVSRGIIPSLGVH